MTQNRPRAIAIARADDRRSQGELVAFAATLALFAITAFVTFASL
jgi:hypothetical protein